MSTFEASFQRYLGQAQGRRRELVPRGVFLLLSAVLPSLATNSLRFAASLSHFKSGGKLPGNHRAGRTNAAGVVTGGQRIFLAHDGKGKALGRQEVTEDVVRHHQGQHEFASPSLIDGALPLLIGEGVETALTAMQASGYPGGATILARLNPSTADLPDGAKDVILLGENDGGKNAAAKVG